MRGHASFTLTVMAKNSSILFISDAHFPYAHPDIIEFLKAVKSKYKPDRVICSGDELDHHSISFHEHNPNLLSPSDELNTAIAKIKPLYTLFPKMDLLESNHGSLVYRKAVAAGLPAKVFKSYRDILGAPRGWTWHNDLNIEASGGMPIHFCHGKSSNVLALSQKLGMSVAQGHHHSLFEIRYWGNPYGLYWGLTAGCLIDDKSLAYAYNKVQATRPVIGLSVILNGHPQLVPMLLKRGGRWSGVLV